MSKAFLSALLPALWLVLPASAQPGSTAQDPVTLTPGAAVEARSAGAAVQRYAVDLTNGQFMEGVVEQKGVDLVIRVLGPAGAELLTVDSPNGAQGPEPFALAADQSGRFIVEVAKLETDGPDGDYAITLSNVLSAEQHADKLATIEADRLAVVNWLRRSITPLASVEPIEDISDLAPFGRALDGVRIVGLGEASHGSRELFQLRHRLVKYLVETQGYRLLALELDLVAGRQIDDFVNGRVDAINPALKPWETEEFWALLHDVRAYNLNASPEARVTVVGFDGQDRLTGADQLLDYLKRVAPERVAQAETLFADKRFPLQIPPAERADLQRQYEDLFLFLDLNGALLIARSSKAEFDTMHALARTMTQPSSIYADIPPAQQRLRRDAYMAENLRRAMEAMGPNVKTMVWAHNGHVEAKQTAPRLLGGHLRALYGREYYALGTSFYEGQYQVWAEVRPFRLDVVNAPEAGPDTAEAFYAQAGADMFFVDFRAGPLPEAVEAWLAEPRQHRSAGGQYDRQRPIFYGPEAPLGPAYDGVMFVRRSTRALPTPKLLESTPEGVVAAPLADR